MLAERMLKTSDHSKKFNHVGRKVPACCLKVNSALLMLLGDGY